MDNWYSVTPDGDTAKARATRNQRRLADAPRSELSSHSSHASLQQRIIHSYSENNNSPSEGDKGVN